MFLFTVTKMYAHKLFQLKNVQRYQFIDRFEIGNDCTFVFLHTHFIISTIGRMLAVVNGIIDD